MMTKGTIVCLASAVLVLGGCGAVAFKQGDGAADLQVARQRCRQRTQATMEQCLMDAGWTVVSAGGRETVATASSGEATPSTEGVAAPSPSTAPVTSWWKMGGSAEDLHQALAGCGMPVDRTCMESQGWQPLGRK